MPTAFSLADQFIQVELERALLSTLNLNPDFYWEVMDLLPEGTLTETQNDFNLLIQAIQENKPLPQFASQGSLILEDPLDGARKLADLYQKRLLAQMAERLLNELRSEKQALELRSQVEMDLIQIQQSIQEFKGGQIRALPELLSEILEEVLKRYEHVKEKGNSVIGVPTGLKGLDQLLGGLQTGVHMLAGEPGQGKTSLVLQLAANVAKNGDSVLFVSFEESLQRLAFKAVCLEAGLEMKPYAEGQGNPLVLEVAFKQIGPALKRLHFIEGNSHLTISQLKAKALQLREKNKTGKCLVIVDYLQRWAAARKDFSEFRHVVSSLVSDLREFSLRIDSPVLVISSQNRSGQGTSFLTSLKESGELEYSADSALFLVGNKERFPREPARAVDLKIEKNRYGDRGSIELLFRPDIGRFQEI